MSDNSIIGNKNYENAIVNYYKTQIEEGKITIQDVPEAIRDLVTIKCLS